jgi:hypothetical protein
MQRLGHQPLVRGTRQQEPPSDGSGPATMPAGGTVVVLVVTLVGL